MALPADQALEYAHLSDIDPDFTPLREGLDKATERIWSLPLEEFRAEFKNECTPLTGFTVPESDISIAHQTVVVRDGAEIGIRIYKREDASEMSSLFLAAHGGGWTIGDHDVQEELNRLIAAKSNTVVVSVNYRLAPEFKFPFAINDCFDVLQWCKLNAVSLNIDPERIFVGGGSAGGNIAAVLALKARDESCTGIIGQVLNIPVICHPKHFPVDKYEYTSYQYHKDAPVLNTAKMDWYWNQYLPAGTPEVYASPLLAESFGDLPPFLIQIAGFDPLRDEGMAYERALTAAGIPGDLEIFPGLPHGFDMLTQLNATTKYNQRVVDWVSKISSQVVRKCD